MDKEQNKKNEVKEKQKQNDIEEKQSSDDVKKEIDNLLKEIENRYNIDKENIKLVRIPQKKVTLKRVLLSLLLGYLLDLFLVIALNGYLAFAEYDIIRIIIFASIFTVTEVLLKQILAKYIFKLMVMSFGLITIPITIISFIFAFIATPGLIIESVGRFILFFVIFMITRLTIKMFIMQNNILAQRGKKQ